MVPEADKTSRFTVLLVIGLLFAGCLGDDPDPEPGNEEGPNYREEVEHHSDSWEVLLMVWPWAGDPIISSSSSGNVVSTGWHILTTVERPRGLQNATFVLEWEDSLDPAPFEHGEFVIAADQTAIPDVWEVVEGTSPLNLTIDGDDWPQSDARLIFRPHDPDTSVAFYTWVEWNLDMTFTKLVPDEEEEEEERGRGSNEPDG